jgi:hypothetical protein
MSVFLSVRKKKTTATIEIFVTYTGGRRQKFEHTFDLN